MVTDATTLRRHPERGEHRFEAIEAILDEALVAHVAVVDGGVPFVLPMAYARIGRSLYLHGSRAGRLMRTLAAGGPACVTVTLLDGLVLARSAFSHSMNFRSVVILGHGVEVTDPDERAAAFAALVDHAVPGRSALVRPPNAKELGATLLVRIPLEESSAKIRSGPPLDTEADETWPVWSGVVPLRVLAASPVPVDGLPETLSPPRARL